MKRILVIDDETNLRLLLRTTLEEPGVVEILEACDGVVAEEVARKERPDLIVVDWMMPGMTGIELVTRLRAAPETRETPIILLTARGQDADRDTGLAAGANRYLVKPFSPLDLIANVEDLLA